MRVGLPSLLTLAVCAVTAQDAGDTALVRAHVAATANQTFRPASGALPYPYLVPAGPYNEAWDWGASLAAQR